MFISGVNVTSDGYEWKEVDGIHYWRIAETSDKWTLWEGDDSSSNEKSSISDSVVMGDIHHNKTLIQNDSDSIISAFLKGVNHENVIPVLESKNNDLGDEIIELSEETDPPMCEHCDNSFEKIEITSWNRWDGPTFEGLNPNWQNACVFCDAHGWWVSFSDERLDEKLWENMLKKSPVIVYRHSSDEIDFSICQTCFQQKSWKDEMSELKFASNTKTISEFKGAGLKPAEHERAVVHIINDGDWLETQRELDESGDSIDAYHGFPEEHLRIGTFSAIHSNENMKLIARGSFDYNKTCYFRYLSEKRKSLFNQFMISLHTCIENDFDEWLTHDQEEYSPNRNDNLNWDGEELTNSERFQIFMKEHPDDFDSENEVAANTNRFLRHYLHHREKSYKSFSLMSKTIWLMIGIVLVSALTNHFFVAVDVALFIVPLAIIGGGWFTLLFGVLHFEDKLLNPINRKENGKWIRRCPACEKSYPKRKWKKTHKSHSKECYNDVAKFMDNNDRLPPSFFLPCFSAIEGGVEGGGKVFFFFTVLFYPLFMPSRERLIKAVKSEKYNQVT